MLIGRLDILALPLGHPKLSFTILNNLIQQFLFITDSQDAQKVANKAIKRVNSN